MSKQESALIKGIAILLMMFYHLDDIRGVALGEFEQIILNASYPITYFLFVSGYGLYYAHRNDRLSVRYITKRSLKLYISFWLVISIFAYGLGSWIRSDVYPGNIYTIITNLIGWRWDYNLFTWFLLPYVVLTFLSKWLCRFLDRFGFAISLGITFLLSKGASFLIARYFESYFQYHYCIYHPILVLQQTCGFMIGACFARATMNGTELGWNRLIGRNY